MIRCVHVIASVADGSAGPSYSVTRLAIALQHLGSGVAVNTVAGWRSPTIHTNTALDAAVVAHRQNFPRTPGLARLCLSADLSRALSRAATEHDILHSHGLWLMPNVYPAWAARRAGAPFVLSPRGMLGEAAVRFSPLKKAAFWHIVQKSAARSAACLHATSDQEHADIRAFGLTNPVAVIPNGIDLPAPARETRPRRGSKRVVLSLGRIHPKKGLDRLLWAWARVEADHPDWSLRIVGPGERGHDGELRALAAGLGLRRVSIEGPLHGCEKLAAYRSADLFVLPTLNENFATTVAESLSAGTPVISTKGAPWSGLEVEGCGWWIDHGVEPLASVLAGAMAVPRGALKAMGAKGAAWMARDFSWDRAARDMLDVYAWLARGAEPPATVRFD